MAAADQFCTLGYRLRNPLVDAVGFCMANQRADIGIGQGRIADFHRGAGFGKTFSQSACDRPVRVYALHRNTHLTGVVKTGFRQ